MAKRKATAEDTRITDPNLHHQPDRTEADRKADTAQAALVEAETPKPRQKGVKDAIKECQAAHPEWFAASNDTGRNDISSINEWCQTNRGVSATSVTVNQAFPKEKGASEPTATTSLSTDLAKLGRQLRTAKEMVGGLEQLKKLVNFLRAENVDLAALEQVIGFYASLTGDES